MGRDLIAQVSSAIGSIDATEPGTFWADVRDTFGRPLGQVSVHVTPNGHASRIDVLLHGVKPAVADMMRPLVLKGERQTKGEWLTHANACRFSVPKEMRLRLATETVEDPVRSLTREEMERIQDCLEGGSGRKGKRLERL